MQSLQNRIKKPSFISFPIEKGCQDSEKTHYPTSQTASFRRTSMTWRSQSKNESHFFRNDGWNNAFFPEDLYT